MDTVVGTSDAFPFVHADVFSFYDYQSPHARGLFGKFMGTRDVRFDDVQVNSLSDDQVQIDPSLAKVIMDIDANTVVKVPR